MLKYIIILVLCATTYNSVAYAKENKLRQCLALMKTQNQLMLESIKHEARMTGMVNQCAITNGIIYNELEQCKYKLKKLRELRHGCRNT